MAPGEEAMEVRSGVGSLPGTSPGGGERKVDSETVPWSVEMRTDGDAPALGTVDDGVEGKEGSKMM